MGDIARLAMRFETPGAIDAVEALDRIAAAANLAREALERLDAACEGRAITIRVAGALAEVTVESRDAA